MGLFKVIYFNLLLIILHFITTQSPEQISAISDFVDHKCFFFKKGFTYFVITNTDI